MKPSLSPEDLALIGQMINQAINERTAPFNTLTSQTQAKDYHTIPEVRNIITELLPEFRKWVASESFELAVIRHFVMVRVDFRSGNYDLQSTGGRGNGHCTRLESQINSAIQTWHGGPFSKGERKGYYQFR